jgi:iron complex outermembrane receptor protein
MRFHTTLLSACSAFALSGAALAATPQPADPQTAVPASQPFGLGEVVVTAPKVQGVQIDTTTLTSTTLQAYDVPRLDAAIDLLPGVNSSNTGGTRNERLIQVRGFNRFQVPLLIDGVRVYLPADNRLDFGRFLTADIAEVQAPKGYVSVLDGPGGMGGEINLVTGKPVKPLEVQVGGEADFGNRNDYEGHTAYGLVGARQDKWYAQVSATDDTVDHWDLSKAFAPTADQPGGERLLSKTDDWRTNLKVGYTPNAADEYSISYTKQEGAKDAPFSVSLPIASQKYWTWPYWNLDSVYFLSNTALGPDLTLKTKLYYNSFFNLLRSFDTQSETTQSKPYAFNSYYGDTGDGGSAQLNWKASAADTLSASFEYRRDVHTAWEEPFPSRIMEPKVGDTEDTYSLALQNVFKLRSDLSLTAGLGYDWRNLLKATDYTTGVIHYPLANGSYPDGQVRLDWDVDSHTQLYAFVSSRARFPTIFERFSTQFGSAEVNPYLKPERATNFEVGGARDFGPLHAEGAAFYSIIDDAIACVVVAGGAACPLNTAKTVLTQYQNVGNGAYSGLEGSLSARLNAQLTTGGNVTWIAQTFHVPGGTAYEPTDTPADKLVLYADWTPIARLHVQPDLEIASDRWEVNAAGAGYLRAGAFDLLNARVAYNLPQGVELAVGARNLLDQNYQLAQGYPEPGRSFFMSARYRY